MPKADLEELEITNNQRVASKAATFEKLKFKKRREKRYTFVFKNGDDEEELEFFFRALGAQEYDKLVTKHPATSEQRTEGGTYNINTFAPDLMARVCIEPEMTKEQWAEIWNSPDWNRGELMLVFGSALDICHKAMDVRPTESVSEQTDNFA